MISILLFGFLASTLAAPQYVQYRQGFWPPLHVMENIFDTNQFRKDMSREMKKVDLMVADLNRQFTAIRTAEEGIVGNEYKITIHLLGYNEEDITVKAREGVVMIQASYQTPGGSQMNYLDVRTLPDYVVCNGTWAYDRSTLTLTFPLKEGVFTPSSTQFTTEVPNFGREEIYENKNEGDEENVYVNPYRAAEVEFVPKRY